jgi:hypothetical protein
VNSADALSVSAERSTPDLHAFEELRVGGGKRSMQWLRKDRQTEGEELLTQAIRICCANEQTLGQRLAEILRLPIPKPPISEGSMKSLDEALRILAYVGAEYRLQGPVCREQIDACIQEIVAGLAATLVRDASPRMRS